MKILALLFAIFFGFGLLIQNTLTPVKKTNVPVPSAYQVATTEAPTASAAVL